MYVLSKEEWLGQYKGKLSERDLALMSRAYEVIDENTLNKENMPWGNIPAISPWPGCPGLWNWDSVFHGMTVSRYNSVLAEDTIDCFAKFQCENGMLPDVITLRGFLADNCSKPPVFPWGILTVYKRTKDTDFLRRNYERSVRYEEFWTRERYDGTMFFYSAQRDIEKDDYEAARYESGWDNSPRWDRWPITELYPIDLNCYMVLYYRSMAEMAEILGEPSAEWKRKEKELAKKAEASLYDEKIGAYVDRNRLTGEFSSVLSPASFMPLFIGIAPKDRAESMHKHARDTSEFYPGMPSVAYNDKGHDKDYWRGLTWLNVAFFAVKGLYDYGYADTAREIKEYILNMCYDLLPEIYENYDSLERKGCGCDHFSWSSAFIIEFILEIK
ncbi:MAG: hypothetical protein IJS78_05120 [Clostridia bacterium]|nr:hypothetical protein [Clostridia bacterium]